MSKQIYRAHFTFTEEALVRVYADSLEEAKAELAKRGITQLRDFTLISTSVEENPQLELSFEQPNETEKKVLQ